VQDADGATQTPAIAFNGLRCQGKFGDQDHSLAALVQHFLDGPQIDLRLPAAGHPVQQNRSPRRPCLPNRLQGQLLGSIRGNFGIGLNRLHAGQGPGSKATRRGPGSACSPQDRAWDGGLQGLQPGAAVEAAHPVRQVQEVLPPEWGGVQDPQERPQAMEQSLGAGVREDLQHEAHQPPRPEGNLHSAPNLDFPVKPGGDAVGEGAVQRPRGDLHHDPRIQAVGFRLVRVLSPRQEPPGRPG